MKKDVATTKVWDPVVRIGHWLLVAGFAVAWLTEDDFLAVHVWAGYTVAVVIGIRMLWGFVGTRHARFRNFLCSPVESLRYLRDLPRRRAKRYLGHNPAGAAMIVALLLTLAVTGASGLMLHAIEHDAGPLAAWVTPLGRDAQGEPSAADEEREEFWEEIHEVAANLALFLVVLHVVGVVASSVAHRENLVRAMITGRKRAEPADD